MERLDQIGPAPAHKARSYKASSIADMLNNEPYIVQSIYEEHKNWYQGLSEREKLQETLGSIVRAFLPHTFSYIILPYAEKPYPHIISIPRYFVLLPQVKGNPGENHSRIEISDITASLEVDFPYGSIDQNRKSMGFEVNPKALRSAPWRSRVILFNVCMGDSSQRFLVHVFNDKARERNKNCFPNRLKFASERALNY